MIIGERIRLIREGKGLSQGEIERRSGMLRCYVSRVENGHTVPSLETLDKFARALEVPLYQIFYEEETPAALLTPNAEMIALHQKQGSTMGQLAKLCQKLTTRDKHILVRAAESLSKL